MKRGIRFKDAAYNASFTGFIEPAEPEQSEAERLAELQQQFDDIDKHRLPCFEKHFRQPKSKDISQNKKQAPTAHPQGRGMDASNQSSRRFMNNPG